MTVTLPNGEEVDVTVPVTIKDTTAPEKDADKYQPEVAKEEVEKGGKVDLTDNVTNLDKLPEGTKVKDVTPEGTIDTNKPGDYTGKVEVTYPDGSKETVDVEVTVKDTTPAEKTENPTVTVPKAGDTKVTGTATPGSTVTVTLPDGTEIKATADKDGNWIAELPEGKTLAEKDEIKVVAKDGDKEPSEEVKVTVGAKDVTPAEKTDAEKVQPNIPDKTIVNDKNNLTKEEKEKVKEAIEKVNKDKFPEGTKVEIGKDGTATITYPDGSKDTIKGSDLVVGKSNGNTSSIQSGSKKSKNLPKAGIESEAMMMAAAALSTLGGLYVSRKKKEDEE